MALVFDDTVEDAPRVHALVIGVGGYPHLLGGTDEREQTLEAVGVLGQLTSPPRSAGAFAQWLLDEPNAWRVPLGSIDLLVSVAPEDSDPLPAGLHADPATQANIQQAYNAWKERCNRSEDNIAVFYFCGHGVEKHEQHLLAEDFGAVPNNPWLGSFAFGSTRLAFHECRAQTQCFFIDACRQVTSGMLRNEPIVIPLDTVNLTAPECAFNLTMQASARNEAALGPRKGISYFTQALLRALQGAAAMHRGAGWVVETGQVAAQITRILRMIKESEGFSQRCSTQVTDNVELLRSQTTPKVHLVFSCLPEPANETVQLTCSRVDIAGQPDVNHQGAPWTLEVDAGFYRASARFLDGAFVDAEATVFAIPPLQNPVFRCEL